MSDKENKKPEKSPQKKYRWLRRLGRVILGILVFLLLVVLFIRSPWGQDILVGQAVSYVKDKTGTEVSLERAFITFDGNIQIDGLYLEDKAGDTLVYSRHLEANLPLWPIIQGGGYSLESANWDGLTARIKRQDTVNGFNYQFLIDAFSSTDTTATTNSEPLQLSIGNVELQNFDITIKDDVDQLDAIVKFERFYLSMNELDLDKMVVDIDQIELKNAIIKYDKDTVTAFAKAEPDEDPNTDTNIAEAITDDAGDSPLPNIRVGNLKIDNAKLGYASIADGMELASQIGFFETSISKADVQNSKYVVDFLTLNNSDASIKMTTIQPVEPFVFEWPELDLAVNDISVNNNNVFYTLDGATVKKGSFNPNALQFSDIHLEADDLSYSDAAGTVHIKELSGSEGSGLFVDQFSTVANITDQRISVTDLKAHINNNSVEGDVELGYESMVGFIENPTAFSIDAAIPSYSIDLNDVFLF